MIDINAARPTAGALLVENRHLIPPGAGTYAVFVDAQAQLLERAGYYAFAHEKPLALDGFELLYVGASQNNLRGRILAHLQGDTRTSALRMTLGVLLAEELDLDPVADKAHSCFSFADGERRLSDWIGRHTRIAHWATEQAFHEERRLLDTQLLPLNASERHKHPFSRHLLNLRAYYAGRPEMEQRRLPLTREPLRSGAVS